MEVELITDIAFVDELQKLAGAKWLTRLGGAIGGARAKNKALGQVEKLINKEWKNLNKTNPLHGHDRVEWLTKRRAEVLEDMAGTGKGSFIKKNKGKLLLAGGAAGAYAYSQKQPQEQQQTYMQQ